MATLRAKSLIGTASALAVAFLGILIFCATAHPRSLDFIEYWSSGRLLIHHADPYSPAGVFAMEKAQGYLRPTPLVMLNPPWTLFLVAPLGFGGLRVGLFFWTLTTVACILIAVQLLNVSSKNGAYALFFAPVLASLCSGQSSPFLLLGFALFLRFHRSRPILAGTALLLMAIKPHLFLIFWVVLLVDCIYRRRFLILIGGLSALVAATTFSIYLDTHIWQHYLAMLHSITLIQRGFIPTSSMLFRILIDPKADWLLFLPSVLGILWGFWYYARWRHAWDWKIHGMLLMLVTILASPYGFFTDEVVLLPSIAYALYFPERRRHSAWILLAINALALYFVLVTGSQLSSRAYLWTPLAWLAWFLYATRSPSQSIDPSFQACGATTMEKAHEA
jgi:hypothetical protein